MLEVSCTNEEKVKIGLSPVTPGGKPVPLDGPIALSVQSGDGTAAQVDKDGNPLPANEFYAVSGDNPGDTTILVSADADLGAGVETISDIVLLHVAGAKAQSLGLSAGSPELK